MPFTLTLPLAAWLLGGTLTFRWFCGQPEYRALLASGRSLGRAPWRDALTMLLLLLLWWPVIPVLGGLAFLQQRRS